MKPTVVDTRTHFEVGASFVFTDVPEITFEYGYAKTITYRVESVTIGVDETGTVKSAILRGRNIKKDGTLGERVVPRNFGGGYSGWGGFPPEAEPFREYATEHGPALLRARLRAALDAVVAP